MNVRSIRVAVAGSVDGLAAHSGPGPHGLEVVAELQEIGELLRAPSHEHEAAIVACTATQLADARFQAHLARLAREVPTVLVVPHVTRRAATVAARARAFGLVKSGSAPEELVHAVRSVVHGRLAYPPEALAVLLRLLPPLTTRHTSLGPTT